jgi:hypothetical protein
LDGVGILMEKLFYAFCCIMTSNSSNILVFGNRPIAYKKIRFFPERTLKNLLESKISDAVDFKFNFEIRKERLETFKKLFLLFSRKSFLKVSYFSVQISKFNLKSTSSSKILKFWI